MQLYFRANKVHQFFEKRFSCNKISFQYNINPSDSSYYENYDYNDSAYNDFASDKPENYDCQTLSLAEPGSDYVGDISVTVSGRKCQNWLDQYPHQHDFSEIGNHNSCRNLHFDKADAPQGVWCYTTDPNVRWEFCSQIKGKLLLQRESELAVGRGSESSLFLNQGWARINQKFVQISEVRELLN